MGMEVPPLRSGSGPVKVGYEKNSDGSAVGGSKGCS